MRCIIDTAVLIWAAETPARLSSTAEAIVESREHDVFVSAVTVVEYAIKEAIRKLRVRVDPLTAVEGLGFAWLPVPQSIYSTLRDLPLHHRDPFDRILIAQALDAGLAIISPDRNFARYPVRVIW